MESRPIGQFDIASGAPFNALQARLGLLREGQRRIGGRVVVFVLVAWAVPLVLCGAGGAGSGLDAMKAYLGELPVWARYFVALALFVIMEKQAGLQLQGLLKQFTRAPLLSRSSLASAGEAVTQAVRRLDSRWAELFCLVAAALVSWLLYARLMESDDYSWAKRPGAARDYLTAAGWWIIVVSNTLFGFLLFRWIWRFIIWCGLLRAFAALDMRLVSTHPDSRGGLGFVGKYPNAFMLYVLALSCVIGAALSTLLAQDSLEASLYGYVMALWLVLVLAVFCIPLLPFNRPLARLKQDTSVQYNALATQHFRASERAMLGENIAAGAEDQEQAGQTRDPSKTMVIVDRQAVTLISFRTLLPVQLAALLPLAAAGVTLLPLKEILALMKKVLLF